MTDRNLWIGYTFTIFDTAVKVVQHIIITVTVGLEKYKMSVHDINH